MKTKMFAMVTDKCQTCSLKKCWDVCVFHFIRQAASVPGSPTVTDTGSVFRDFSKNQRYFGQLNNIKFSDIS